MKDKIAFRDPVELRQWHQSRTLEDDSSMFSIAIQILDSWQFSDEEKALALGVTEGDFKNTLGGRLTVDQRTRVSLILGMHKGLSTLLLQKQHHIEWIAHGNKAFDNYSPKEMLLSGSLMDMYDIRRYLDSQCG
ncbi:MAG: hypothetical protein WEA82_09910 [Idiomarina sp.]